MVLVVLVVLVVLEVPDPEIRILQEISSPEPAGNVREASGSPENVHFSTGLRRYKLARNIKIFSRNVLELEGTKPEWLTPEWVLVLVLVVLAVVS